MMNSKLLPGMTESSTEFFVENDELKIIQNGRVLQFHELSFATVQTVQEYIDAHTDIKLALMDMVPNSKMRQIEQFLKCRFGGLDANADLKACGEMQDGEFWPCPNHGHCPFEGVLCKLPMVNGHRLNKTEFHLIRHLTTIKTNELIAEELDTPLGTFHLLKKRLYDILNVSTKQELTLVAIQHSII